MPRKPLNYKIPYIKSQIQGISTYSRWNPPPGSVPDVLGRWIRKKPRWEDDYEWKPNDKFDANLKFLRLGYGGKAEWENTENGAIYHMSLGALEKTLLKKSVIFGTVLGTWKFKKHGWSYSIVPVV